MCWRWLSAEKACVSYWKAKGLVFYFFGFGTVPGVWFPLEWADPILKGHIRNFEKVSKLHQLNAGVYYCLTGVLSVHVLVQEQTNEPFPHVCLCCHRIPVGQVGWKMRRGIARLCVCRFMTLSRQTTASTVHYTALWDEISRETEQPQHKS